jgi:hypothetical protein
LRFRDFPKPGIAMPSASSPNLNFIVKQPAQQEHQHVVSTP